jgi:hypothetical protein
MQDEIIKHSRKIFRALKSDDHSFAKKTREVIVEIFIIVFAVSFSIWLHGLKEHNKEQKEVRMFLKNICEDLKQDTIWQKADLISYRRELKGLNELLSLTPSKIDSMERHDIDISFPLELFTVKINNGNYEGFKSSGRIGYIENEDLKKTILLYYQQDALNLIGMNDMINQYQIKTLDVLDDALGNKSLLSQKIQVRVGFLQLLAASNYKSDSLLLKKAADLISAIDQELKR